jgi:hypothetical protein
MVRTYGKVTEERSVKKMLKIITVEKIFVGRQQTGRLDDFENGLRTMDVRGWRKIARIVTNMN